jgi:sec-independent protein translocase protein TatC
MAAPLIILYGVSIFIVRMVNPDTNSEEEEETETEQEKTEKP